jgi:cardiolipin synthase
MKRWIRLIFRRRIFVIITLLIQIVFILFVAASSGLVFVFINIFLNILSFFVSLYILNKKEKAAFKLTWIFLILLVPFFGGLVYVIFHSQANSRKLREKIRLSDRLYRSFYSLPGDQLPLMAAEQPDRYKQARYLQEYAGFPLYSNTETEYFPSGEAFFKRVLPELEKAEQYIFLEFFILSPGIMLDPILDIMEKKARQGLDVRLIYDDLGCLMTLPTDYKQHLEKRGIKCMVFNPFKPILSSQQNNRDHRKIVCIDGKTAFTGGMNLADEYINARERFGHWKDAAIMLKGEGAWGLTLIFLQTWNMDRREQDDFITFYPWQNERCTAAGDGFVQPYADSPIDEENVGEHVYIKIINNAQKYVYINTPYLVVDDNLLSALTLAAKSGIDVRIITPHRWDKKVVAIVSRSYYRELILAGVRVYEYSSGFNHSKTFVSDDAVATVGTTNLDFRSLYLHFECGVCLYRTGAVMEVKNDFLNVLPGCREITLKDCARNGLQRILQDVLRLFAPLM